jgi:NADH pyrophosphatase NudC (nudix superfamily)
MLSIVDIAYLCEDFSGFIKAQAEEVTDLQWFSIDELPENISPPVRPAMRRCVELLKSR